MVVTTVFYGVCKVSKVVMGDTMAGFRALKSRMDVDLKLQWENALKLSAPILSETAILVNEYEDRHVQYYQMS